jgi:heme oxygenase (biliverdin-IX-beta and delta-forming)
MARGPLLTRLRNDTDALHRRIETAIDLLSPEASLDRYAIFLLRFRSFLAAVEPPLAMRLNALGYGYSPREGLAAEDLAALGHAGGSRAPAQVPDSSGARAIGCAYVLEGSTMGGQIVAKALEGRFGPTVPTRFLRPDGGDPTRRWRAFRAFADSLPYGESADADAISGARDTFVALDACLRGR